jgi:hypothetical protein
MTTTTRTTRAKKCPPGQISRDGYTRKGYTRKDGTRVKPTKVPASCIPDRGEPGKGKDIVPELREGKLGGPGYLKKSAKARHAILNKCVKKYGYISCLRSLQYLLVLGKNEWSKSQLDKVRADMKWLEKTHGKKKNPEHHGACCSACSIGKPCESGCEANPKKLKQLKNKLLR